MVLAGARYVQISTLRIYIYDLVITRINKKYSSEAPIRASQLYVCTYYINKSYFSGRSRGHFL